MQLLRSYTTSNLLIDARPLDADEFHCATCADSFSLTMDNQTISVAIPKSAIPNYQYDNLYSEFILWPLDIYQQAINSQYKGDLFLSNVFDLSIKYKSSGEEYPINSEAGGDIIIGIPNLLALDAMKKYDIAPQDVQCLTRFTEQYYSVLKGTYEEQVWNSSGLNVSSFNASKNVFFCASRHLTDFAIGISNYQKKYKNMTVTQVKLQNNF